MAPTAAPSVLRSFRAPEYRDLTRAALDQGWDVYRRPGGHVAAVNPSTGAHVDLSMTAYVTGHTLRAKRHEFAQAGLDLRSRSQQRQEARSMHVREVTAPEAAAIRPTTAPTSPDGRRHPRAAGGQFALVAPPEVLTLGGYEVRLGHRADGKWVASTRDLSMTRRLRQWYGPDRADLLAKVAADLVARPPEVTAPRPDPRTTEEVAADLAAQAVAQAESDWPGLPEHVDGPWHVVRASAEEYPLAAALDALESATAPALQALRAAGKADAADLLTAEVSLSPQEAELLALYRRVMRGD